MSRPQLKKTPKLKFSKEEDAFILNEVQIHGVGEWSTIASKMTNRGSRQVRERYFNYLAPDIKRNSFTIEEDELLIHLVTISGRKWANIARVMKTRAEITIKNRVLALERKANRENRVFLTKKAKNPKLLQDEEEEEISLIFDCPLKNDGDYDSQFPNLD
jgi:myb proto-oncogene protein